MRKAQNFNNIFPKHCIPVENTSKLLINFFKRANNLFSTISFTKNGIAKITRNRNPNKAHGFDIISIRMLKICGDSAFLNLRTCIESGKFPIKL